MKYALITFLISIAASVVFISCKKTSSEDEEISFTGIVVSYPSRQPQAGKKVYLVAQGRTVIQHDMNAHWKLFYLDTIIWPPKFRIDSAITDANGRYTLSYSEGYCPGFTCAPSYGYYATMLDPNYVRVYPGPPISNPDTIFIDQPSYFTVNLHKNTAAGITDTLFENRYYYNDRNELIYAPIYRKAQVGQTNTTISDTISTNAYSKVVLEWRHYKNGLQGSSIDTIILIPNGTTVWNVNY